MIERKNIDRVFQENLKDLEMVPSKKVWTNIEQSLNETHYKKTISLWQRLSGVAMVLVFLLSGGFWYSNVKNTDNSINEITKGNSSNIEISNQEPANLIANKSIKNSIYISPTRKKQKPIFIKSPNNVIVTSSKISTVYKTVEDKYIVNEEIFSSDKEPKGNLKNIDDLIKPEEEKIAEIKKWSAGPTVAPVYYNTLQNGSSLNSSLAENSTSTDDALSVGISINYQLSKKIKLQSGVNKVELAYNTKGVNAFISTDKNALNNIHTSRPGVILSPISNTQSIQSANIGNLNKSSVNGNLNQSIEYFELPIEMKYNLYDKKVGLNLVGGFSTFFLSKNTVAIVSQNNTTNLGEANNLNDINFSGNLGLDLDYKITKSWYLNVSPMFKYQFNTFSSNSGNFKPYYLGVYSGLNFKF